jgi:hypothetical protein
MRRYQLVLTLTALFFTQLAFADDQANPCAPIAKGCVDAGYTMGDNTDKGFWKNCMQPVLLNQTVSGVTLDAKDVKACRQFKIAKMKVELKQLQKVK